MVHKKKLLKIIMIPVLIIVLVQSLIPFGLIIFSRVKESIEENTIHVKNNVVENRQLVLENDMIDNWSSIYRESSELNTYLEKILEDNKIDIQKFIKSKDLQKEYLKLIFPNLVDTLKYNTTSGIYIIIANDCDINSEASYRGFFVRDSDPQNKTQSNDDLLMERGGKELAQNEKISLDSAWTTDFNFLGSGKREADSFFYKPYLAANMHKNTNMENMGYWAEPFILEDNYLDNHKMITYSVPLQYEDTIYGILGIEISVLEINKYFQIEELDEELNAGYAIAVDYGNNTYEALTGKGNLYDVVTRGTEEFSLTVKKENELYKVNSANIGKQNIYTVTKPITLYNNNVPYENNKWVLCGFVTENYIYGAGRKIYRQLTYSLVGSIIISAILVYILIKKVTKPVYRLVDSIRGGVEGIHNFKESDILEIDEIHDVVENLTDAQQLNEEQLTEEKERYKIAVENSQSMFFTYTKDENKLELINSGMSDGVWDCSKNFNLIHSKNIHPADRDKVFNILNDLEKDINIDFRMRVTEDERYIWVNLKGIIIRDKDEKVNRIVGRVDDITQRKMLDEKNMQKLYNDSVTTFYRMEYGLEKFQSEFEKNNNGTLVITDINRFSRITKQYGIIFGDILIKRLACIIKEIINRYNVENVLFIRAGIDQIIIWLPYTDIEKIKEAMEKIVNKTSALVDENQLFIDLKCGLVQNDTEISVNELIKKGKAALYAAKKGRKHIMDYSDLSEEQKVKENDIIFGEVDTYDRLKNLSKAALAFNMFDKNDNYKVILDILFDNIYEEFDITGIIITDFNREYLVNNLAYQWKCNKKFENWDGLVRYSETDYQNFLKEKDRDKIHILKNDTYDADILRKYTGNEMCIVYHMSDNGQYSGSIIFFANIKEHGNADWKELEEISIVIQNKINMNRHDSSAQAKTDFLARMSHEIRTPMNGIIGMTEIALNEGQSEARRIECLKKIQSSSNYLLGILNDILDMSKIESGKMKLVIDRFSMLTIIKDIEILMEAKLLEKNIQFTKDINITHTWFMGDELRINQILVNLLSNAIKYSGKNGHIKLTINESCNDDENSKIFFAVKDDGIGIAKDKQKLIFQRFEQADDSEIARKQGTGLGLSICTRLVHMMNSEIELESEPGKGSTFSFEVLLKQVREEDIIEENDIEDISFEGKRVLVAEDNPLNMEIACTLLEEYGIITEEACNGEEAVKCVERNEPGYYDLILMDVMMPVMDGLEATKAIRKINREDCKKIPIYAMSANAFDDDIKHSLSSGMNGHLSKPVNVKKLKETLAKVFKGK